MPSIVCFQELPLMLFNMSGMFNMVLIKHLATFYTALKVDCLKCNWFVQLQWFIYCCPNCLLGHSGFAVCSVLLILPNGLPRFSCLCSAVQIDIFTTALVKKSKKIDPLQWMMQRICPCQSVQLDRKLAYCFQAIDKLVINIFLSNLKIKK